MATTGSQRPERPADPPANLGVGPAAVGVSPRHQLVVGDPTALADAYTRHGDRLLAIAAAGGQPPLAAAAVARAALVEVWEHPLRFPADDDALAQALAAEVGRLATERSRAADEPARPGGPEAVPGFLPDWRIRSGRSGARSRPARPSTGPMGEVQADPRTALLAAALARRPAVAAAPSYAAPFAAWIAAVDRVLAELTPGDWDRPTDGDGRTPREVVARLAGLDAALAGAIGIPVAGVLAHPAADDREQGIPRAGTGLGGATVPDGETGSTDQAEPGATAGGGAGATADGVGAARAGGQATRTGPGRSASYWPAVFWPPVFWPPVLLWQTWHEGARGLCAWLAGREPESASILVDALGWTAPVEDHLTSRMLATWLDGDALAAVAGVRLPALDAAELRAATTLALHRIRWRPNRGAGLADGPLALTLTTGRPAGRDQGPDDRDAGADRDRDRADRERPGDDPVVVGRWLVGPGRPPLVAPDPAAGHPPPVAELRLDVVDFCLLAAGRRTPAETAACVTTVSGDPAAGHALLAGAAGVLPA